MASNPTFKMDDGPDFGTVNLNCGVVLNDTKPTSSAIPSNGGTVDTFKDGYAKETNFNSINFAQIDADYPLNSAIINPKTSQTEPSLVLFLQILFPFFIAGFGMVLAGIVFDIVQNWQLFKEVPETFILVPALLGLKGNLEMTLASRLSTLANLGSMDTREQIISIVVANVSLIQAQAIVVTFLASAAAVAFSWIPRGHVDWSHVSLLCASSLATASLASFLLSGIMIIVVLFLRRYHINPDNVATPIAASLGDLTTIGVLSMFGSIFLQAHIKETWLNIIVIVLFFCLIPFWAFAALQNHGTREVLLDGWSPIVLSMLISSSGGFVLERAMRSYKQMALFQPIINGVGGNLAAVQASRLSTFFHKTSVLGVMPNNLITTNFCNFKRALFSSDWDARSARVLLLLVVPGHMVFNWLMKLLDARQNLPSSALFTSIYLLVALSQVTLLLFICQWLVALLWQYQIDPDNAAIPYLTALGDLLGTSFLFCAFTFLNFMHPEEIIAQSIP